MIAVVGVLVATMVAVLAPGKQLAKLHDSQREQDIKQIQTALDTYYNDKNCYPLTLSELTGNPVYIKSIPQDPEGVDYYYITDNTTLCPQWETLYSKNEKKALKDLQNNFYSTPTTDDCPLVSYTTCLPRYYDELYNHCEITGSIDSEACSVLDAAELPVTSNTIPTLVPGGCYCENAGTPNGPKYDVRAGNCNLVNSAPFNFCDANCSISCQ